MKITKELPIEEADFFVLDGALFYFGGWEQVDKGRGIGLCVQVNRVTEFRQWDWWETSEEPEYVQVERMPATGFSDDGALDWWKRIRPGLSKSASIPDEVQPSLFT